MAEQKADVHFWMSSGDSPTSGTQEAETMEGGFSATLARLDLWELPPSPWPPALQQPQRLLDLYPTTSTLKT